MSLSSESLLPDRATQQALLRDLTTVLREGGAAPFRTHVLVEPYARFFPDSATAPADPVQVLSQQIFAYAGVPNEAGWSGDDDHPAVAADDGGGSGTQVRLGQVCRRAAKAWRDEQGLRPGERRSQRLVDLTAVCLGFGALLANEELSRLGGDGGSSSRGRDPSVDWRRQPRSSSSVDMDRWLGGAVLSVLHQPLTAAEFVFLLAAQVVVRSPTAWSRRVFGRSWQARVLDRRLRPAFVRSVRALSAPRDSLAAQLGFRPMPKPRRRTMTLFDGSEHFMDFHDLLGVERVMRGRRGPFGDVLKSWTMRLRCSSPRCGAPLPAWSPLCVVCGREVKGEAPLAPRSR